MILALIIEDEVNSQNYLKQLAEEKFPEICILECAKSVETAVLAIESHKPDLVFLDVQMPDLTGIQFLKIAGNKARYILTTAYPQYALESYDLNVADYLLKPFAFDRFYKAAEKVFKQLEKSEIQVALALDKNTQEIKDTNHSAQDFIFVKTEHKIQKIELKDILYIEGLKDYISIFTATERIITLQNMKKMEESLPQGQFIRVHKSYIIALDKIACIERSRITIADKTIPIGDTYRDEFFKLIDKKNI
jgi:DNA-binding LytR/AlgR family response regulator